MLKLDEQQFLGEATCNLSEVCLLYQIRRMAVTYSNSMENLLDSFVNVEALGQHPHWEPSCIFCFINYCETYKEILQVLTLLCSACL